MSANETIAVPPEVTMAELKWRCRRGMLELDVFLVRFLEHGYPNLPSPERDDFYELLDYQDQELIEILQGMTSATDSRIHNIAQKIRDCAAL